MCSMSLTWLTPGNVGRESLKCWTLTLFSHCQLPENTSLYSAAVNSSNLTWIILGSMFEIGTLLLPNEEWLYYVLKINNQYYYVTHCYL